MRSNRKLVASFVGASMMLLNAMGLQATMDTINPLPNDSAANVFNNVKPGTPITPGMQLGQYCKVIEIELAEGGFAKRSSLGAFAMGDHINFISIECETDAAGAGAYGKFYLGDQDWKHDEAATEINIDGAVCVPPYAPDVWSSCDMADAHVIIVTPHGDSFGWTLEAGPGTTTDLPGTGEPGSNWAFLPSLSK